MDTAGLDFIASPSQWVVQHAALIRKAGRVLDLACGNGRNAIWLARQGFVVEAQDRDEQALAHMRDMQNIHVMVADIENGAWPLSAQKYDGIVVCRYLFRPLLARLATMLNPDGVLIYETFMTGNERYGRPQNPDFLLKPDELKTVYAPVLEIKAFWQGEIESDVPAVMQRICAINSRAYSAGQAYEAYASNSSL